MTRLVRNLLDNATQHSDGPRSRCRSRRSAGATNGAGGNGRLVVDDDGPRCGNG